ncbi:RE1 [Symbiodinium sp. CCMP2592]|nr:RE1 [Symbiodinium sp. CCMP2592]
MAAQQSPATGLTEAEVTRQLTQLTAALQRAESSPRELQAALGASQERTQRLEQQLLLMQQQAGSTAPAGGPASSAALPAVGGSLPVSPVQLGLTAQLKGVDLLKPPKPLKSQDEWERFVCAAMIDPTFPQHLEEARKGSGDDEDDATLTTESEEYRALSVKLFGMLVSLVSECPPAFKIARGIRRQDGFLLWKQLWREFHPEQANRGLIWRRALLSPKFPNKEADFSAALQEWESDLAKYEAEFGSDKAISEEDKRALLMVESPGALKQHLAMTAGRLTKYKNVRNLVVSYLQAKRVWTPSGAYAQPTRQRHHDPDQMEIGKVGDKGKDKGKGGKGKEGKGKEGKGKGGKGKEGKGKDAHKEKEKEKCPICWCTGHTVKECWYNSKGKGKGNQKGGVHAVADDTASQLSAGPSASVAGSTATTAKPGVRHISDDKMRILAVTEERRGYLLVDTGATVSVCRPETFQCPVNPAGRQNMFSVDDTPLDTRGTVEPVLRLGGTHRQEARTTFQVVGGITDDILSVSRAVDAGARVVFDAAGSYIEWEDGCRAHTPTAQAVADFARAERAAEEERQALQADPEERERHKLTHVPFAPWCPECVQGAGRGGQHRRKTDTGERGLEAVVQMDYTFYSRGAQQKQAPEDESTLVTVLTLVDKDTGWPCSVQVPKKGAECGKFVLDTVEQYLNTLGAVEGEHSYLAGLVRTWLMDLQNRYPNCMVDVNRTVFPWLVKYAAWSAARFQVRTTDKMTAYKIVNGVEYLSTICRFGETVMAKLPKPGTKSQRRWVKGIWVGKLDRDNTHIVLTESGALSIRSVRRLPPEGQANRTLMGTVAGVPWALRQGRVLREPPPMVAQPVVLPAPSLEAAANEAPDDYREQEGEPQLPTMAHEGEPQRVDTEALDVEAAAILEDLDVMEDTEVFPQAGGIGDTAPGHAEPAEAAPDIATASAGVPAGASTSVGAGSAASAAASPSAARAAPYPTGLGEGGLGIDRLQAEAQNLWERIEHWANAGDPAVYQQRLASVMELLDSCPDPAAVQEARLAQLQKLWRLGAFTPVHKWQKPAEAQVFHYKWVDKVKEGTVKSRFTCADIISAHALLEITALQKGCATRSFDIVAAFLIGQDRGAQQEKWVYVRPPPEWRPIWEEWVRAQPPAQQPELWESFDQMLFRLDGNLYGRRTAGSVYRDELEELLCVKLKETGRYDFRCAGDAAALDRLLDEDLCAHCEITTGPLEAEGVSVEVLGKTKTRLPGCILTAPDPKHAENIIKALGLKPGEKSPVPSRKPDLSDTTPLEAGDAARYRSAVGPGIYLSADRRDIQYAVKELARHMSAPRRCDMNQAQLLGRYLQQHPSLVRVTALDPGAHDGTLQLDVFCDSDWAGCVETRRSTDCHVVVLGGAVVTTATQTQPGLPATSSPDAELRGISRACREALFVHELATLDFGLEVEIPRIWGDSSTGITAAKRIGPGTKLRHLDVSEFYVQGAVQAGKTLLRKVKGTENPANFLTKHAKTGNEVAQALPSLAMVDPTLVAGASAAERHSVKLVRENPPSQWKPVLPFKPTVSIVSAILANQILGVRAQPREEEIIQWTLQATMLLGILTWLVVLWFVVKTVTGQNAATAKEHSEPTSEPEEELPEEPGGDEVPEEVATPPVAVEDLFRAPARAAPPRDLRPPAPEPEPHDGDAGAAAEAAAPPPPAAPQVRARRRRLQPGARLPPVPQHQFGELYYAPTRRTVHLYRNCVGSSPKIFVSPAGVE